MNSHWNSRWINLVTGIAAMLSLLALMITVGADNAGNPPNVDVLAEERQLIAAIVEPLSALQISVDAQGNIGVPPAPTTGDACNVNDYADRVVRATHEEVWPVEGVGEKRLTVEAEIWTAAIQAALDEHEAVFIPGREKPYYLDRPLVLRSGHRLIAGEHAELRMKPNSNFCMVRNENMVGGQDGPVALGDTSDHDIIVCGGIWTTLAMSMEQTNGNVGARADDADSFRSHGVLLFSNVRNLQVRNLTVRQCKPHGIQISNCSQFLVDAIRFENQRRDGVHMNGPVSYGVVRNIRNAKGWMGDDMVALNAWDWKNTSMTFGPIHHVLVENVNGSSVDLSTDVTDIRSEIRLLAGTKRFDNGTTLACDIEHCVLRSISGIRTFKMYDQPNLELGRDNDFAEPIGTLRAIYVNGVTMERPTGAPLFQIALNGEGIAIHHVRLGFDPAKLTPPEFSLVQVGPMSWTIKLNPADPATWVEVFSPDKDCVVSGLRLFDVSTRLEDGGDVKETPLEPGTLVKAVQQTLNPDYPNTTPRGGTGRGILK